MILFENNLFMLIQWSHIDIYCDAIIVKYQKYLYFVYDFHQVTFSAFQNADMNKNEGLYYLFYFI